MAAVVPRRGRQHRMRLDRVRGLRRLAGVDGVEVGVEADRVVAVAPQRSHAVVMAGGIQRVADGVGQNRVRADLDEGPVLLRGSGDGLAEQRRLTHIGHPVVGIQHRRCDALHDRRIERDGRDLGSQILRAECNSPRIGSMKAVWDATSMLTRRAKRFCAFTAAITASTAATEPATTVSRGEI